MENCTIFFLVYRRQFNMGCVQYCEMENKDICEKSFKKLERTITFFVNLIIKGALFPSLFDFMFA